MQHLWIQEDASSAGDEDFLARVGILQHERGQVANDISSMAHSECVPAACKALHISKGI